MGLVVSSVHKYKRVANFVAFTRWPPDDTVVMKMRAYQFGISEGTYDRMHKKGYLQLYVEVCLLHMVTVEGSTCFLSTGNMCWAPRNIAFQLQEQHASCS